jgi:hypothetical protein
MQLIKKTWRSEFGVLRLSAVHLGPLTTDAPSGTTTTSPARYQLRRWWLVRLPLMLLPRHAQERKREQGMT